MNNSTNVAYGDSPTIFERLRDPETMGAVLQGAFTTQALASAHKVVSKPTYNTPRRSELGLPPMIDGHDQFRPLVENLDLLKRMFSAVGSKLLGSAGVFDLSRIEPSLGNDYAASAHPWHSDRKGRLVGLAVPAGTAPDIQIAPLEGQFDRKLDFIPRDPLFAERSFRRLGNADFAILKVADYPFEPAITERGAVHRRSITGFETFSKTARIVIHYKSL